MIKRLVFNGKPLRLKKALGEGSYAVVYQTSDDNIAAKQFRIDTPDQIQQTFREISAQSQLRSVNNLRLFAVFMESRQISQSLTSIRGINLPTTVTILMERSDQSLFAYLNALKPTTFLPERDVLEVAEGCANALSELHALGITHRDFKLENVLLACKNSLAADNVRVCDFGSASTHEYTALELLRDSHLRENLTEKIQSLTTPQYRAPELVDLLARMDVTRKVDVFALGVTVYRIMYKVFPFREIMDNFNAVVRFPDEDVAQAGKYAEKFVYPVYSD